MAKRQIEKIERYTSQKALAKKLGVSPRSVRRWKQGIRKPSKAHQQKMNRILAGYKSRGRKRPEYRTSVIRPDVKSSLREKWYPENFTVMGHLPEDREDLEMVIKDYFWKLKYNISYQKDFKTIFKWFNKKTSDKYLNSLQILMIFDGNIKMKDGNEVFEKDQVMASIALVTGLYENREWLEAYFYLVDDLLKSFLKWINDSPNKYVNIHIKSMVFKAYKYQDR